MPLLVCLIILVIIGSDTGDCQEGEWRYNFYFTILIYGPTILLRVLTHLLIKNEQKYVIIVSTVELINFLVYGGYVIYGFYKFLPIDGKCFNSPNVNTITFILVAVGGLQPAAALAILACVFILCFPCILVQHINERRN